MSVTYTFSPNTRIKSSEVNQNNTDIVGRKLDFIGFKASRTLNQNDIVDSTYTVVACDAETFDAGGYHSNGIFTAPYAGYYYFGGQVVWDNDGSLAAAKRFGVAFYTSGGVYFGQHIAVSEAAAITAGFDLYVPSCGGAIHLDAAETVSFYCWHNRGNNTPDVLGGASYLTHWFGYLINQD